MSATFDGRGAALENAVGEVVRIDNVYGPVSLAVTNLDTASLVVQAKRKSSGALVALTEDTAVAAEDTAYDGDTSTLDFTGEALNNVPIVPGSVTIKPTAGGTTVNATDRDGDGKLYTADDDEDECGSINYFTGALELHYPTGKAPNTTNITADYTYSQIIGGLGKKTVHVPFMSAVDDEVLIISVAGSANARVRIEAFVSLP